eukprot:6214596-Pleurochrysis_carterae.AAC.5
MPGTSLCTTACITASINFDLTGLNKSACPSPLLISTGSVVPYAVSYLPDRLWRPSPFSSRSGFISEIIVSGTPIPSSISHCTS